MNKKVTKQVNPKKNVLAGNNIYRTKSGQAIFYNKTEKIGYRIPANKEGLFQTLLLRHYICIIIGLLIYFSILPNILLSIAVPLFLLFLLERKYRSLLRNVTQISNYSPIKFNHTNKTEEFDNDSSIKLILKSVFFLVIGILFIVNGYISSDIRNIPFGIFCSYIAAAISFFFGFRIFRIFRQKKNHSS